MSIRTHACRRLLIAFAVVTFVFGVPQLFFMRWVTEWVDWNWYDPTSAKILGAALVALGVASLQAAREPCCHRIVVRTNIVFTFFATLGTAYRLLLRDGMTPRFTWAILAIMATFFVLFCVFYPRRRESDDE